MGEERYMSPGEDQLRQQLASITVMDHGTEHRLTPEYVHQHMYAAVINTEKNAEMLERCPHEAISNLSMVAKCELGKGRNLLVTNEFVQLLRMSGEEIVEHAKANSMKEGYVCQNLSQIVKQVFLGDLSMEKEVSEMLDISEDDYPMYVVTTSRQYDGASVIVSKPFLEDVHKKLGEDYYVLPSSRHEVLAVPVSRAPELPDLKEMVHVVNETEVQDRDWLSDDVYYFDGRSLKLADTVAEERENSFTESLEQGLIVEHHRSR